MINVFFVVIMVVLAIIDIKSTKSPNHKNFKSSIVLVGILGVLSGLFVGFYDFDIENIKDSMPNIAYGLQISFYTLVASIALVVIISIYQKLLGFKKESKEDLDFIALQTKKLDRLEDLLNIKSINDDIKEVVLDIKNAINKSIESNSLLLSKMIEINQDNFEMLRDSNVSNSRMLLESNKSYLNNILESNTRQIELLRDVNINLKNVIEINRSNFLAFGENNQTLLNALKDSNDDFKERFVDSLNKLGYDFDTRMKELSINIDNTLNERITNLSSNFTNTINLYFSENFKRFNKGVDNLIDWQEQYRDDLSHSKEITDKQAKSLEKLTTMTSNIIKRDEGMIALYSDAAKIMKEYRAENQNLSEKLQTLGNLKEGALTALQSMNVFFNDLNTHLKETNANLINNTKDVINNVFVGTTREFESQNKAMINSINTRNTALLTLLESLVKNINSMNSSVNEKLESSIKDVSNLGKMMLQNNKDIYDSYKKLGSSVELSLSAISQHTSDIMNDINKDGIESLENTAKSYFDYISSLQQKILSDMSNTMHSNQAMLDSAINNLLNKYLESLEQITLSNVQSQKELSRINIEEMKTLNNEVSNYIKENALSLNKSNIEILNIVEFLQKELEDSMEKSNILQDRAKDSINDIEKSLHKTSESFKNDYEWFLRRIRDIIGQRM